MKSNMPWWAFLSLLKFLKSDDLYKLRIMSSFQTRSDLFRLNNRNKDIYKSKTKFFDLIKFSFISPNASSDKTVIIKD